MRDIETLRELCNKYEWNIPFNQYKQCNAYVSDTRTDKEYNIRFQLVKSYETIVGFVDHDTKEYIELGKWSVTTSQQVSKIYRMHFSAYKREFLDIR